MDSKVIPLTPQVGQQRVRHGKEQTSTATGQKSTGQSKAAGTGPKLASLDAAAFTSGKGGGALRSIDQTFEVNPCNGTLSLSFPLHFTEGRNQFHPSLALSYSSGSGNGPFGFGWGLSLDTVTRKTSKAIPQYDESDTFLLSGADDLIPLKGGTKNLGGYKVMSFRPRVEQAGSAIKIELWTNAKDANDSYWRTISDANTVKIYGRTDKSRVFEETTGGLKRIFSWLLCEAYDPFGNAMILLYKSEDDAGVSSAFPGLSITELERYRSTRTRAKYIKSIMYGNREPSRDLDTWAIVPATIDNHEWLFEVLFDYGEHSLEVPAIRESSPWSLRQDLFSSYSSGFEIRTHRLCRRILMFHHIEKELHLQDYLVSSYELKYDQSPKGSFLLSTTFSGHMWDTTSGKGAYITQSLAPCTFEYTRSGPVESLALQTTKPTALQMLPRSLPGASTQWIDLHGEGMQGLLHRYDGAWYYQRNENALCATPESEEDRLEVVDEGQNFGPLRGLSLHPNAKDQPASYFEDVDGNGYQDLVVLDDQGRLHGYLECTDEKTWTLLREFPVSPNLNTSDETIQRIDLTGSGRSDIVLSGQTSNEIIWYESLGKRGFANERRSHCPDNMPQLLFRDERSATYQADVCGDGLTDILLVSNGRISYWPNLGYGKFDDEIVMDRCPIFDSDDKFTPERIRLLDCDGSGTTDILYLLPDGGAHVYYNLCGNIWSEGVLIASVPSFDKLSDVFAMDLLGKGTSCLCWTGPEGGDPNKEYVVSYLDLGGAAKPNLLKSWSLGTGISTSITYSPSTKFYLQDERSGKPWTTKLPFPVQTVSRVVEKDDVLGSTHTTRYRYHDGYYDGYEREFRGFGVVDQWETEDIPILTGKKNYKKPVCHTKLWFHTGSEQLGIAPSNSAPFGTVRLQSSIPPGLYTDDILDAYRALKGSKLRSEVYGEDHSDKTNTPYVVEETSYDVILTSASQGDTHPATFRVQLREKLSLQYERNEADARVTHDLVLETNKYGDVTKAVHAQYGRQTSQVADARIRSSQSVDHIEYAETTYTNGFEDENNDFYKPLIASKQEFHVARPSQTQVLILADLRLGGVSKIGGTVQKGKESRTYYRNQSLDKPLDLGKLELFSVVDQEFQLAMTRPSYTDAYGKDDKAFRGLSFDELVSSKHCAYAYLKDDKDKSLWIPSNRLLFGNKNASKEDRLKAARKSFFIPSGSEDPFGIVTEVFVDDYRLLPVKTVDAAGNMTKAENNYRVMQGGTVTDANNNRAQGAYDCLGHRVALARMGKVGEVVGDSLDGVSPTVSDEEIFSFLKQPTRQVASKFLGKAGSRLLVCRRRLRCAENDPPQPTFRINLARTEHAAACKSLEDALGDICVNVAYLDGRGREFQQFVLVNWDQSEPRWSVTTHEIRDAGGNAITSLTPYFSSDCISKNHAEMMQPRTISFVDALGRQLGILTPDHSWTKAQVTPWSKTAFDAGDNILVTNPVSDPDVGYFFSTLDGSLYEQSWHAKHAASGDRAVQIAVQQSSEYANKPTTTYCDSRGKSIATVEMGNKRTRTTYSKYDVFGNPVAMYNALGRLVEQATYDLLGRPVSKNSMDAGSQMHLLDCLGNVIIENSAHGIQRRYVYDGLRRRIQTWVWEAGARAEVLWSKIVYGEADKDLAQDPVKLNLRNKISVAHDQAGIARSLQYDFKGNCLGSSKQLAVEYKTTLDWNQAVALQDKPYIKESVFDALNRETSSNNGIGRMTNRKFDLLGGIQNLSSGSAEPSSQAIGHVTKAEYTPDGKASRVEYSNSSHSAYAYDEDTRRLVNRRTWRDDGTVLEDITYTYDCLGRIVHILDKAQQTEFFRNCQIVPTRTYRYDDFGRLANATGRETINVGSNASRSLRQVSASSPMAKGSLPFQGGSELCNYTETYTYDDVDNILKIQHDSADTSIANWTRDYHYEEDSLLEHKENTPPESSPKSNRLTYTNIGKIEERYGYDGDAGKVGCMTSITGYSRLEWDANNRLRCSARQKVNEGSTPQTTWYVYDDNGDRVRKVTESEVTDSSSSPTGRKLKETIYLESADILHTYEGNGQALETTTYTSLVYGGSVQDKRPVATIEDPVFVSEGASKKTAARKGQLIRYHVNTDLEVDDSAQVISYEEYSPFGVSVLLGCKSDVEAPRRYRFAGYHRDHETGLYACGARYYAPWLGRWTSPDPLGTVDGPNVYAYVNNDPINC